MLGIERKRNVLDRARAPVRPVSGSGALSPFSPKLTAFALKPAVLEAVMTAIELIKVLEPGMLEPVGVVDPLDTPLEPTDTLDPVATIGGGPPGSPMMGGTIAAAPELVALRVGATMPAAAPATIRRRKS